MKKLPLFFLLTIIFAGNPLQAQTLQTPELDTLPKFALTNAGKNRIIISWVNNFSNIKQISIQRSFDSLTGYKTILTVPDPTTPQNGYVDAKAINDHMFYRLYIMLDKGVFLFSNAKRPVPDSVRKNGSVPNVPFLMGDSLVTAKPFVVKLNGFPSVTDSVAVPNINGIKPVSRTFTPSLFVYTFRDGYVRISLPEGEKPKKYSVKFFEEDNTFLFEIKEAKEKNFKIDKTNFYHGGWFRFELYEDGKLLEKHKFYLEKDF